MEADWLSLYFIHIPRSIALRPLMTTCDSSLSAPANSDIKKDMLLFLFEGSSSVINLLTALGQ